MNIDTRIVQRRRTADTRMDLALLLIAGGTGLSRPPDFCVNLRPWNALVAFCDSIPAEVFNTPDLLAEAILGDEGALEAAWEMAHERCCEETAEIDKDLWYEGTNLLLRENDRPAWIPAPLWDRLSELALEPEAQAKIENDLEYLEAVATEATRRHIGECVRGSVGGNFHSIP